MTHLEYMKENAELALETLQLEWQTLDKRRSELKAELTDLEHQVAEVMSETEEAKFNLWYLGLTSDDRTTLYMAVTNSSLSPISSLLPPRLLSRSLAQGLVRPSNEEHPLIGVFVTYRWHDAKAQIVEDTYKALTAVEKA